MNTTFVTNVLLTVIASLLLVSVIQNAMNDASGTSSPYSYSNRPAAANPHSTTNTGRNPTLGADATDMAHSMFFQALSGFPEGCDSAKTLAECSSTSAEVVKKEILEVAQSRGPREVFDYIIEKYGMTALTEQAQQIRRARTGQ